MEKYKILEMLGEGAFGKVYKALNKKTGETVAIKKLQKKYKTRDECMELQQVKSLQKLKHTNITKLQQVLQEGEQLYLVFEYLEVNLFEYYSKRKQNDNPLSEKQIKQFIYQILQGLAHMHKNGFFHRDMKPENLLILGSAIKLCDFGLAREIRSQPPFTQYVSTRWYRSPELLLRSTNYNSPVDIFALGCIMAELYTFNPLFAGSAEVDQLNKIVQVLGTPDQQNWPQGFKLSKKRGYYFPSQNKQDLRKIIPNASDQAIDFMEQTLQYNSKKRPKASELLKHPFLSGITNKITQNIVQKKQIIFNQNLGAKPINTEAHDKKHDIMKLTKQKFFRNTKGNWKQNNEMTPVKKTEKFQKKEVQEDLQAILKQLQRQNQQRNEQKRRNSVKHNKQKPVMQLRQSKTQMGYINPFRQQKQMWGKKGHETKSPEVLTRKQKQKQKQRQQSNNDIFNKKLNYSFQPAPLFPFALKPISKFQTYGGNSKQNNVIKPNNNYQYNPPSYQNYPSYPSHNNYQNYSNPFPRANMFKQKSQALPIVLKARNELNNKFKF